MRFSLRRKTALLIVLIAIILSGTSIAVSGNIIKGMIDEQYKSKANDIADTIAVTIDVENTKLVTQAVMEIYDSTENRVGSEHWGTPEFDEYIALFSQIEDEDCFKKALSELRKIQDVNDVDCVYLMAVDSASASGIYIVDAALEDACPPGCFDPIYEVNSRLLEDPTVGFPAYITNTEEYGWLVTAGTPIYDEADNVVAYAMVDISMDEIRARENTLIGTLIVVLAILTIIIISVALYMVDKTVVNPINTLSQAAAKYCQEQDLTQARIDFASIDIKTGDEVEILAESMKQMERDINDNIANLMTVAEELSTTRKHADIMNELATKDALTGVRNKMSYDMEVERLARELEQGKIAFGMAMIDLNYLKRINDNYGHEKGNVAIQKLCHIICVTFVHSPVFRVGGDEFVVILQNNDYENVKELVGSFNVIIEDMANDEELEPWERISAAIGYALFDQRRDVSVEDVFKRADGAMYIRKKEMKSIMV